MVCIDINIILIILLNYLYYICRVATSFVNDSLGCNSVSWAPFTAFGNVLNTNNDSNIDPNNNHINANIKPSLRLVTGSCDTTVRIWKYEGQWENQCM